MQFPGDAALISLVLVALGQAGYVQALLDRNRDEVHGGAMTPRLANVRRARALFGLSFGVLMLRNAVVLFASFLVSTLYQQGGICWSWPGTRRDGASCWVS